MIRVQANTAVFSNKSSRFSDWYKSSNIALLRRKSSFWIVGPGWFAVTGSNKMSTAWWRTKEASTWSSRRMHQWFLLVDPFFRILWNSHSSALVCRKSRDGQRRKEELENCCLHLIITRRYLVPRSRVRIGCKEQISSGPLTLILCHSWWPQPFWFWPLSVHFKI